MRLSLVPPSSAIVAIPAQDEAGGLVACLAALALQRDPCGAPLVAGAFEVLVLANNCRDDTADAARAYAARVPYPLHVVEHCLAPEDAHAGGARRLAMNIAADRLTANPGRDGIVLTTDADSRAGPTWVSANLSALAAGVDAVAGYIDADPREYLALGTGFVDRGRLEDRFLARVAELYARLDPRRHDPWPNHRVHSGASFAVTLSAYRAVGGLPARPLGEDSALAQALENAGFLIRHSLDAVVVTSCRFDSRARGGAGDTMRQRHENLDAECDADLEPVVRLFRRARVRGLLRRLHEARQLGDGAAWRHRLGLGRDAASRLAREGERLPFALLWERIEAASPALRSGPPLRPSRLPDEIAKLERLLRRVTGKRRGDPADIAARGAPPPVEAPAPSPR